MCGMEMWELAARESVRQTLADDNAGTDRNRIADVAACFAPDGLAALTNIGVDHWGRYRDVLVPVGDSWLFASREASADGFSPQSLMR